MKKFFIFLFFLPFISFSQTTYVPDNVFESYLENNNMGDGIMGNNLVLTANISDVIVLDIVDPNITDLTGIEDFTHLANLQIQGCNVNSLDLSNNYFLQVLNCRDNNLTNLDINSGPFGLVTLLCENNNLTSLDVSSLSMLDLLLCSNNMITDLNITGCDSLRAFDASYNQLTSFSFLTDPSITAPIWNPSANNNNWVFSCHANLEYINLSHNNLSSITLQGAPLPHHGNQFVNDIPSGYWVSTLSLSDNNLTEINFDESQVHYLDVSNNQLEGLFFGGGSLQADNNNLSYVSSNGINNLSTLNNPNLLCIEGSPTNSNWTVDPWTYITGGCAIAGCMDPNYLEFNPAANLNDNSCVTPAIVGCLDSSSIYYNVNANQHDYDFCLDIINECHVYLGEDTILCNNLTLNAPNGYGHYSWNTGEITQSIIVNQSGNYSVSVANTPTNEKSFHINGDQQYIEINGTEEQNPGQWYNGNGNNQSIEPQSMTVSAWVKVEGLTLGEITIVEKWDDWNWGGSSQGWLGDGTSWRLAFTSPDLRPYVQVGVGVPNLPSTWPGGIANGAPQNCATSNWSTNLSGSVANCFSPNSISLNTWYYISFTWDPFGNSLKLYVNGVEVNQTTFTTSGCSPLIFPSLCNITIGNKPSSQDPTQPLLSNVYIDEVGVWDTSLTSYHINYYMSCPPIGTHPKLVGFWDFENTLHTDSTNLYNMVFDKSTPSYTGMFYNGPTLSNLVPYNSYDSLCIEW